MSAPAPVSGAHEWGGDYAADHGAHCPVVGGDGLGDWTGVDGCTCCEDGPTAVAEAYETTPAGVAAWLAGYYGEPLPAEA